MRLGFDARMATWAGVGTYSRELLRALVARRTRDDLHLVCFRRPGDAFLEEDPALGGIEWRVIPGSVWSPWSALRLAAAARDTDLFHTPHFVAPLAYPGPLIATVHDVIPLDHIEVMPRAAARAVFERAVRTAARRAQAVLCGTRFTARRLAAHGIRPRDLWIAPYAPATDLRPVDARSAQRAREKYGLPPSYVLWLGALRSHKNVGALLTAYRLLPARVAAEHPLVLAGSLAGPELARLQPELDRLGQSVVLAGPIAAEDLAAVYSAATVFVFPSLIEGYGLPPLEAAACGTAVLCSSAQPLPEVMGGGAAYFEPRDPQALAGLLERVLTDSSVRSGLAGAAARRAAALSWEATADLTQLVYRTVLQRRAAAGR